jgi:hypothetical protein
MLKINADKTEVIVFTSQKNEKHIESISVKIGGEDIKPSKCVRNLGAFLDSKMSISRYDASCSVLQILKSIQRDLRNTIQERIAIVQA